MVGANSPDVDYTYTAVTIDGNQKNVRLTSVEYPSGRDVYYNYGTTDDIDDRFNRLNNLASSATPTDAQKYAEYAYLGAGTVVELKYPAVTVSSNPLALTYGASGTYAGFDRFGRVVDQKWEIKNASPTNVKDRYKYGYDAAGNRTSRDVDPTSPPTGKDEKYTYDGLDRLKSYDRGTLSGGNITNKVRNEAWTLSQTGNWGEYKTDANGDGDYSDDNDLDQNRTNNKVNEIYNATAGAAITEEYGPQRSWADPAHDLAGNMTTVPKPTDMENTYACKYDAWNRMVETKAGENVVGRYEYDGLNRRIKKHIDTQAPANPNGVDIYRHFFYNSSWQIVETRKATSEQGENTQPETLKPEYQYVWSLRYIDAPILRDENEDNDDYCDEANDDERLYYLNDANMNVTCLVDSNGDAVERYMYDPYGNVTFLTGVWAKVGGTGTSSAYDNNILFCGYYRDAESGLYQVRRRPYHIYLGWITRDPLNQDIPGGGYHDGPNLYEYVGTAPIGLLDPFGLYTDDIPPGEQMCDFGGYGWRGGRAHRATTAKERALAALAEVHQEHTGYMYYEHNNGWLIGLRPLIWDKLNAALWWLDECDYNEQEPGTGHLKTANAAYTDSWLFGEEMYISTGTLNKYTIFHEAIHAYNDMVNKYDGPSKKAERKNEGIAYAAQYMAERLKRLQLVENELDKKVPNVEIIKFEWRGSWFYINNIVGQYGKASGKNFDIKVKDVWRVRKHLAFKVRCTEIAAIYNKHEGAKRACIEFHCVPNAKSTKKPISVSKKLHPTFE